MYGTFLLQLAALIIILAGLKTAQAIILPLIFAVFISILAIPAMRCLRKISVPKGLSILLIVSFIVLLGAGIGLIIGSSAKAFTKNIPFYEQQLAQQMTETLTWLQAKGVSVDYGSLRQFIQPQSLIKYVSRGLNQLGGIFTQSILIVLIVVFVLLESTQFYNKLVRMFSGNPGIVANLDQFVETVNRYMVLKSGVSLVTGTIISVGLFILDIHYPILWGFLAFLLNFIPNVGSIIAAIPAILLGIVQGGLGLGTLTFALYLGVNFLVGNLIEPRFLGRELGLSPLIILLSLLFWGWIFGPIGMFLAVPLTMFVKIGLECSPSTKWVGTMMGRS